MALRYRKVERTLNFGEDEGVTKVYGQVRAGKVISFDQVCRDASAYTTATKADMAIVVSGLEFFMERELGNGKIVQMGDLGNFRITGGSSGVEKKEDFTLHLMKKPRITFSAGSILRDLCSDVKFVQESIQVEYVDEECDRLHLEE